MNKTINELINQQEHIYAVQYVTSKSEAKNKSEV